MSHPLRTKIARLGLSGLIASVSCLLWSAATSVWAQSGGGEATAPYDPFGRIGGEESSEDMLVEPSVEESPNETEVIFDPEAPVFDLPQPITTPEGSFNRSWFRGDYLVGFFFDTVHENLREDTFLLRNRLELRAQLEFEESWTAVIEGRLEYRLWGEANPNQTDYFFNSRNVQGVLEPSLGEAYISARFGRVFVNVGNQTVVWGAGTLSQPAAVINPIDYGQGTFDKPADQRIPILAAESSLVVDRLSLSAVVVPVFVPDKLDVFGTDFALFRPSGGVEESILLHGVFRTLVDPSVESQLSDLFLVTRYPQALPQNFSAGARIASSYGQVDVGLGYFYGWDRTPYFELDRNIDEILERLVEGEPLETPIVSEYRRRHTIELDLVTYIERLGIRFETAASPRRTLYTVGYLPRRYPVIESALAFGFEDGQSLVAQLEGYWTHTFSVPQYEEILLTGVDDYGLRLLLLFGLDWFSALDSTPWGDLSIRLVGAMGLSTEDLMLFPSLCYTLSEALKVTVGAMIFEGPDPDAVVTIGGFYDENDQLFVSVEVAF